MRAGGRGGASMTRNEISRMLEPLALHGNHLVVHASLSSFGHVEGGAAALCAALLETVSESGTIVMPAFTCTETLSSSPGTLAAPRTIAFHPDLPVSREVGVVAEVFRRLPGVLRSNHPTHSFIAWGRQAREVLSTQRDNNPLGPLKKLNVMQGQILLLGTLLDAVTAIHLAEERLGAPHLSRRTALRVNAAGYDERVVLENVPGCSAAFVKLDEQLDPAKVRSVPLERGTARKIPIRYLVNLASAFLGGNALAFICDRAECASCAAKRERLGGQATPKAAS
jgi:aminoglycoside 3-N-acetyltransferase